MAFLRPLIVSAAVLVCQALALPQISERAFSRRLDLNAVSVSSTPSNVTGGIIPESFVSFSIEFAFFPDYAGNKTSPNDFSNNLLNNLKSFQGSKPYIRVGGNTQDYALYNGSLQTATNGTYIPSLSVDYPIILYIGPSYYESFNTWPDTKFTYGWNLAKNGTVASTSWADESRQVVGALNNGNLLYWEMGNEPDLFKTSSQGAVRPSSWNESDYVADWQNATSSVEKLVEAAGNTTLASTDWIAPSFAGTNNSLNSTKTWQAGLDSQKNIALFSSHNYIGGATQPGVTLGGTLMNHTKTVSSVQAHINEKASLAAVGMDLPYILGEANSLYNEGAPGLSNTFGAALWGVDFNLYCAATGIKRVHMHMGTNFRYASWQPVQTNITTKGTKPPYYGNIAVAAALGDLTSGNVSVANIPLEQETEAAYAIYNGSKLNRLMVINMVQYNYTSASNVTRQNQSYSFTVPASCAGNGTVQRLMANGSDAITGVTFNGNSYNYELDNGKPQLLGNVTKDESIAVGKDGGVEFTVPWSSAALIQLTC